MICFDMVKNKKQADRLRSMCSLGTSVARPQAPAACLTYLTLTIAMLLPQNLHAKKFDLHETIACLHTKSNYKSFNKTMDEPTKYRYLQTHLNNVKPTEPGTIDCIKRTALHGVLAAGVGLCVTIAYVLLTEYLRGSKNLNLNGNANTNGNSTPRMVSVPRSFMRRGMYRTRRTELESTAD